MLAQRNALRLFGGLTLSVAAFAQPTNHSRDLVDIASSNDSFETLTAALSAADLVDALRGHDPLTVFAPTDEAFAKLPKGTLDLLLQPENKERLVSVLTYHVVAGDVSATEAVKAGKAKTLQGKPVGFAIQDGRLQVAGANVVQNDVEASNGRIHVIDSVLLPPGFEDSLGRKVIGVYFERPSRALAEQLGFDRDEARLVTGVTENSNAQVAGLRKYDIILSIDGHPARKGALDDAKAKRSVGDPIPMTILRAGKRRMLEVPVGLERH